MRSRSTRAARACAWLCQMSVQTSALYRAVPGGRDGLKAEKNGDARVGVAGRVVRSVGAVLRPSACCSALCGACAVESLLF